MEKDFKYILLDFDGTLFDTQLDILASVNAVRKRYRLEPIHPQKIHEFIGYGAGYLIRHCFRDFTEEEAKLKDLYWEFHDYYMEHPADHARYYPGVQETMPMLKNKIIVSNKPEDLVVKILEIFKIRDQFLHVIGGDTFAVKKPDFALMEEMIRQTDIRDLQSSIMIGDGQPDHDFAKNHELPYFCCNYGFSNVEDNYAKMKRIDSFDEILNYIDIE